MKTDLVLDVSGNMSILTVTPDLNVVLEPFERICPACGEAGTHTIVNGKETEHYCAYHFDEAAIDFIRSNKRVCFEQTGKDEWTL